MIDAYDLAMAAGGAVTLTLLNTFVLAPGLQAANVTPRDVLARVSALLGDDVPGITPGVHAFASWLGRILAKTGPLPTWGILLVLLTFGVLIEFTCTVCGSCGCVSRCSDRCTRWLGLTSEDDEKMREFVREKLKRVRQRKADRTRLKAISKDGRDGRMRVGRGSSGPPRVAGSDDDGSGDFSALMRQLDEVTEDLNGLKRNVAEARKPSLPRRTATGTARAAPGAGLTSQLPGRRRRSPTVGVEDEDEDEELRQLVADIRRRRIEGGKAK